MSRLPKPATYRRRTVRGRSVAYVTIRDLFTGRIKDFWLGPYGSPESHQAYSRLIAEWTACEGRLPDSHVTEDVLTIQAMTDGYWAAEAVHYAVSEEYTIRSVIKLLSELYGDLPAIDFGPISLRAVRDQMVAGDPEHKPPRKSCNRATGNRQVQRIRSIFRWAIGQQLLPPYVLDAVKAVEPLRAGRTAAAESEPVCPVDPAHVEAVLPFLGDQVAAMVRLQTLTGMRPGEVCALRISDLDMSDENLWVYRPARHKTAHRGKKRAVYLGPQAIAILRPYVSGRQISKACFSPSEAEAARRRARHEDRVTPLRYGNRPGTNRAARPKRTPGDHYTVDSYRRAIQRACDAADRVRCLM